MYSELIQFAVVVAVFLVAATLWLRIVYLPARTLEDWDGEAERDARRRPPRETRS